MRNRLMLIILAISAAALLFVWFSIEPPVPTEAENNAETGRLSEPDERKVDDTNARDSAVVERASDSVSDEALEANTQPARDFERKYVVGKFVAPEQLQIAVYRAVNDELDGYVAYVNNMECDSGDCNIDIRIVAPTEVSAKSADLFARINTQLADNPLTRSVMVGIRSIRIDENRDGRLELVTMPASTGDDIARARAEFDQRKLQQSSSN